MGKWIAKQCKSVCCGGAIGERLYLDNLFYRDTDSYTDLPRRFWASFCDSKYSRFCWILQEKNGKTNQHFFFFFINPLPFP